MRKILFAFILSCTALVSFAQDMAFTQYYSNPTYTNPAFVGAAGCGRITSMYRKQWPKITDDQLMAFLSYDQYLKFLHGGIGLNLRYDQFNGGGMVDGGVDFIYAAHFNLGKKLCLQPAIQIGYSEKYFDPGYFTSGDMIDPYAGFIYSNFESQEEVSLQYPDIGGGMLLYGKRFYGGLAMYHINQPNVSLSGGKHPLPAKYVAHAGYTFGKLDSLTGNPDSSRGFLFSADLLYLKQHDSQQILPGVNAVFRNYSLGLHYRSGDALIIDAGFRFRFFRIGYSYDMTLSELGNDVTGGSHEISLVFRIGYKKEREGFRPLHIISY